MSVSSADPSEWRGSEYRVLAHDFGLTHDFSTALIVSKWTDMGRPVYAVQYAKRFPHGLSPSEIVETVMSLAHEWRVHEVVADVSSQHAHLELLAGAAHVGVCPLKITSRAQHANDPSIATISVGGRRTRVPIWMLSRTVLIDGLYPFFQSETLHITQSIDGPEIVSELGGLSRDLTRSSNVVWTCPPSGHDDLAISAAIGVWALHYRPAPKLIVPRTLRAVRLSRLQCPKICSAGWT